MKAERDSFRGKASRNLMRSARGGTTETDSGCCLRRRDRRRRIFLESCARGDLSRDRQPRAYQVFDLLAPQRSFGLAHDLVWQWLAHCTTSPLSWSAAG